VVVVTERWPRSLSAYQDVLSRCVRAFAEVLPVERVILFGSHARGQNRADSDVDLCVVTSRMESQNQAAVTLRQAIGRVRGKPPLSIIPISATRLEEKVSQHDPFFDTVLAEGICVALRDGVA